MEAPPCPRVSDERRKRTGTQSRGCTDASARGKLELSIIATVDAASEDNPCTNPVVSALSVSSQVDISD